MELQQLFPSYCKSIQKVLVKVGDNRITQHNDEMLELISDSISIYSRITISITFKDDRPQKKEVKVTDTIQDLLAKIKN